MEENDASFCLSAFFMPLCGNSLHSQWYKETGREIVSGSGRHHHWLQVKVSLHVSANDCGIIFTSTLFMTFSFVHSNGSAISAYK